MKDKERRERGSQRTLDRWDKQEGEEQGVQVYRSGIQYLSPIHSDNLLGTTLQGPEGASLHYTVQPVDHLTFQVCG